MSQSTADLQTQIEAGLAAAPAILGTPGPITLKPKQRLALSGITHGLTGQNLFLAQDEYPAYMDLGSQYMLELRPVGVRETQLAQRIIDLNWRLNTTSSVENNLFHSSRMTHVQPDDPNDDKTIGMTSKATTWREDCEGPNAFEKLGRYETRLERSLFKTTAEFERLQANRLRKHDDTFDHTTCKAWIWYDHMLALHAQLRAARRAEALALSTTSGTELLCKKPATAASAASARHRSELIQFAAVNGILSAEDQDLLERYAAAA